MKILLVEDNAKIRRLVRHALSATDYSIFEVEDGADCLDAYRQHRPDLVLMDIRMPRVDGLSATRLLKRSYPGAKIIMLTDYDEEDLRIAASEAGACGYALKMDLSDLEVIVGQLIQ